MTTATTPNEARPTTAANVVLAFTSPPLALVTTAIEAIRASGARVVLVGPKVAGYEKAAAAADRVVLLRQRSAPVQIDPDRRPERYSPQWASVVTRNLTRRALYRPARRTLGISTMWWLSMSASPPACEAVDEADVITALDAGAVYAVWECAQRNPRAAAINGIGPTMEHLGLAR